MLKAGADLLFLIREIKGLETVHFCLWKNVVPIKGEKF